MVHFFPYTILPWWFRKQPEASTAITGRGLEIAGQWAKCLSFVPRVAFNHGFLWQRDGLFGREELFGLYLS